MEKTALVPVADGSEELEAICIVDVLRRAGIRVDLASVDGLQVAASKGVKLVADCLMAACLDRAYDAIVLPGGMPGSEHLRDARDLIRMLRRHRDDGRIYGAICAAPAVVLHHHGLIQGSRITCHPNFRHLVTGVHLSDAAVVVDGNLVTSQGAGTAVEFSLKLVEILMGQEKAREVAAGMAFCPVPAPGDEQNSP